MEPNIASEEMVFYPRRARIVLYLLGSLAFVALGLVLVHVGERTSAYPALVFFGLCAAIFALQLVPGASFMRIDAQGITLRALFRTTLFPWSTFDCFTPVGRLITAQQVELVGYHLAPGAEVRRKRLVGLNQALAGCDGAFDVTMFGRTAIDVAELLNARLDVARRRASAGSGRSHATLGKGSAKNDRRTA